MKTLALVAAAWLVAGCRDVEKQKAENDYVESQIAAASAQLAAGDAYERDRDAIRAAKPKTEAQAVKVMGRQPTHIVEMGNRTLLQWTYNDGRQPGLLDVIQVTIQDGGVTGMNL